MTRVADYPIHTQFTDRWSPRAFTGESISQETLLSFFEAARWAPSAYNSQPWRFLYARRDTPDWERFLGLLNEFNRGWAQHASALVIIASKTDFIAPRRHGRNPGPVAHLRHRFRVGPSGAASQPQRLAHPRHGRLRSGTDPQRAENPGRLCTACRRCRGQVGR